MCFQDDTNEMWLQVNMIDETGNVVPVWYLPASQVEGHQWITGRVKLVSRDNSDQYRVNMPIFT
jgi:hypothetical protein